MEVLLRCLILQVFWPELQAELMIPFGFDKKVEMKAFSTDYEEEEDRLELQALLLARPGENNVSQQLGDECSVLENATCQYVDVNIKYLEIIDASKKKSFAFGFPRQDDIEIFYFKDVQSDSKMKIFYFQSNEGSTSHLLLNGKNSLHGVISLTNRSVYGITNERCGAGCHRLVRYDKQLDEKDDIVRLPTTLIGEDYDSTLPIRVDPNNLTIAKPTITVYITDRIIQKYVDFSGYVNLLIHRVNVGYEMNRIPIQLQLHCIKKFPIPESDPRLKTGETWQRQSTGEKNTFYTFTNLGNPQIQWNDLRHSADIAFLLLSGTSDPAGKVGQSVFYVSDSFPGLSMGVCFIEAAMNQFTLDHELAHLYGAKHQKGVSLNLVYNDGYGYLIPPERSGLRTILSYSAPGHETRLQYYSSDTFRGQPGNLTLGTTEANNRRILMDRRFYIASIGDESIPCADISLMKTVNKTNSKKPKTLPVSSDKLPSKRRSEMKGRDSIFHRLLLRFSGSGRIGPQKNPQ